MRSTTPRASRRSRASAIAGPSVSMSWNLSEDDPALRTRMRTSVGAGRDEWQRRPAPRIGCRALPRQWPRYPRPRRRDFEGFVPLVRFDFADSLLAIVF